MERKRDGVVFCPRGRKLPAFRLRSMYSFASSNGTAAAEFKLRNNEIASFILEEAGSSESPSANADFVSDAFKQTMNFWLAWIARSHYRGGWREMVNRSALTLKLLTSQCHGSIVAAPTFGLPAEHIGGVRNWDYRYTWIRDASFTLYALMRLGYTEEASAFMHWLGRRCQELKPGSPLQVAYRLDGNRWLPEEILPNFSGYMNSPPGTNRECRCQPAASCFDIYGELMDSVYIYDKYGEPLSYGFRGNLVRASVEWVCAKKMALGGQMASGRCAAGRGRFYTRASYALGRPRPGHQVGAAALISRASGSLASYSRRNIPGHPRAFLERKIAFLHPVSRGTRRRCLVALLTLRSNSSAPPIHAGVPRSRRFKTGSWRIPWSTVTARWRRRRTANAAREGTFSMCSFWYVECLARAGDLKLARFIFEKALGYANHVGLYAEQLGPSGETSGQFSAGPVPHRPDQRRLDSRSQAESIHP